MCEESCSTKNTIKLCSASLFFLTDSATGQSLIQLPEAEDNNTEGEHRETSTRIHIHTYDQFRITRYSNMHV